MKSFGNDGDVKLAGHSENGLARRRESKCGNDGRDLPVKMILLPLGWIRRRLDSEIEAD